MRFEFEVPVAIFEKADAEAGKQRRIAGIISTETTDRQNDVLLQRGLDFDDFLQHGWFNDNHSKATDDILGYPDKVIRFKKGDRLPDGTVATSNGTWAEGYLLDTKKAQGIWELGQALAKTSRRLGFSVEGKIEQRTGPRNRVVAKAKVRNVAITNCPVNTDTRLEVLAKSLQSFEKALGMGTPVTPGHAPVGPQTGMGAGMVLTGESLEQDGQLRLLVEPKPKKRKINKSLTTEQAIAWVQSRVPGLNLAAAGRVVQLTELLKQQGRL